MNNERVAAGLAPLQIDGALIAVARERSNDMIQQGYFAHVSPSGETAFSLLDRYGIPYGWAGENLARNNYPDEESVAVAMRDWMASEGHRENILNVHYTAIGVGAAVDVVGHEVLHRSSSPAPDASSRTLALTEQRSRGWNSLGEFVWRSSWRNQRSTK